MKETKTQKSLLIFFSILIFCILAIITVWLIIEVLQEQKIPNKKIETPYIAEETSKNTEVEIMEENNNEQQEEEQEENNISQQNQEQIIIKEPINTDKIIQKYKGYDVEAKLEIPAIQLETYVIKPYTKQALNISVTKFWGANANQIGNFCIAGHNFQNKMMFRNLKKLSVGEKVYITDQTNQKVAYKIYDIYTVQPKDVKCLSQETNGKREITLITCTTDSKKRIIVKANAI